MKISEIKIFKIPPNEGLVGFASCIIEDCLFLGNIAIFSRARDGFRLIFPEKKTKDNKVIRIYHPINKEFYFQIESEIINEFIKLNQIDET